MVLSEALVRAARGGDRAVVAAWLESGGGRVDDLDGEGMERTLLLCAAWGRGPTLGLFDESHVALARYLLDHGADVNRRDHHSETPLHWAAFCHSESSPAMVALLLKAGANLVINSRRHTPLSRVLYRLARDGSSRPRMEIAIMLLRALPSLDHETTVPQTSAVRSAEQVLDNARSRATPPLPSDNCFEALRAVVAGVRAAGGWRAYDRKPRAEVLRLRSLAQRGRAVFLPSTTRHYDYAYIRSLQFLVRCPPEIAWHVLGYWRCHYPVDTQLIDQLGYR